MLGKRLGIEHRGEDGSRAPRASTSASGHLLIWDSLRGLRHLVGAGFPVTWDRLVDSLA